MDSNKIKLSYKWNLSDNYIGEKNNKIVFGTYVCGGGSTMGYKLSGFNHIGGVELTTNYSKLYKKNHSPIIFYTEDIRLFNKREDLPSVLYNLDILDGSPPCASFSTSGAKERLWGKKKNYEGINQRTDDLIDEYATTVLKLLPKSFLMENVSGLLKGNSKSFAFNFIKRLEAVYDIQVFSLNASSMGVPQIRQRVFIIGIKKTFKLPKLILNFSEKPISFSEATKEYWGIFENSIKGYAIEKYWEDTKIGESHKTSFNLVKPSLNLPCNTLTEKMSDLSASSVCHPLFKRKLNTKEACLIQSFPIDYDFLDEMPLSCIGRSVPPLMIAKISNEMLNQWLSKI
jgi:DNA (cytosine-5)-methyltransferase 1